MELEAQFSGFRLQTGEIVFYVPTEEDKRRARLFHHSVNKIWESVLGGPATPALIHFKVTKGRFDYVHFGWSKESPACEQRALSRFKKLTAEDGLNEDGSSSMGYWLGTSYEEFTRYHDDKLAAFQMYRESHEEAAALLCAAVERLEDIEPSFPAVRALHFDLARFYYEQKMYTEHDFAFEKGLQYIEDNLEARPEYFGAEYARMLNKLAQAYLYRGELTPALGAYARLKRALNVVPGDVAEIMQPDWSMLARFYDQHGRKEDAAQTYQSILNQIDWNKGPDYEQQDQLNHGAKSLLRLGYVEAAERAYELMIDWASSYARTEKRTEHSSHEQPCLHWFLPYLDFLKDNNRLQHRVQCLEKLGLDTDYDKLPSEDTLFGYVDIDGKWKIPPRFENACNFENGVAQVVLSKNESKHFRAKLIDKNGKIVGYDAKPYGRRLDNVVPHGYKQSEDISEGLIKVYNVEDACVGAPYSGTDTVQKYGFADEHGNLIIEAKFTFAYPFDRGVTIVGVGGYLGGKGCVISVQDARFGLIDHSGKYLIEPKYLSLGYFNQVADDGLFTYRTDTGGGVITKTGEIRSELLGCDERLKLECGMAAVEWGAPRLGRSPVRKYGFLDSEGRIAIENKFDFACNFSEDRAQVTIREKEGFINRSGRVVIEPVYEDAEKFENGLARVKLDGKWGCIDANGAVVIAIVYDAINWIDRDSLRVKINGKYGAVDRSGAIICEPKFDRIEKFSHDEFLISLAGLVGTIDKAGVSIIELQFRDLKEFSAGLAQAAVLADDGSQVWGFIDKAGAFALKEKFAETREFSEGLAAVRPLDSDLWGYISDQGVWLIEPQFEKITNFVQGRARVSPGTVNGVNVYGIIDQAGHYIVEPKYAEIGKQYHDGLCFVGKRIG